MSRLSGYRFFKKTISLYNIFILTSLGNVATVTNLSSDGVRAPDNLTFTYTDATFQNPNVTNDITINITGIDATGTGRDNYLINKPGTADSSSDHNHRYLTK